MDFNDKRILGKTGLRAGRLGIACSYGAPTEAFEEAFERGVNYFYWGSMRKAAMVRAIRNIIANGKRDELIIVMQSYSRSAGLMDAFYRQGLKTLGIETADVLLLGWHNHLPSSRILDQAEAMREKGMFRYLALSGHNRLLFPDLAKDPRFDILHIRYNAAHRGAEKEVFSQLDPGNRPALVTYTATRWGELMKSGKMPPGEAPLRGADCYRFVLTNPNVDICMTGPKSIDEMREALTVLDQGPLALDEMQRVRRIGEYVREHSRRMFFG
jgi:aryl-alcohol dehydrogenase-like predicted oxidoreductase